MKRTRVSGLRFYHGNRRRLSVRCLARGRHVLTRGLFLPGTGLASACCDPELYPDDLSSSRGLCDEQPTQMVTPGSFRFQLGQFQDPAAEGHTCFLSLGIPSLRSHPAPPTGVPRTSRCMLETGDVCWTERQGTMAFVTRRDFVGFSMRPSAFSSLFPKPRIPRGATEGQGSVCQALTLLWSSLPDSVRGPQPPAPHRPGQLRESAQQEPRGRRGAVPVPVRAGQRHPGPGQRQQAHPLQVSDAPAGEGGAGVVPGGGGRSGPRVQCQKPASADSRVTRDPPSSTTMGMLTPTPSWL